MSVSAPLPFSPLSAFLRSAAFAIAAFAAVTLSACVTDGGLRAGSPPVPLGNGLYSTGTSGPPGYGDDAYQRAVRFCFDQGRQLLRVDGTGAAVPRNAGGEVLFRCVGPGEPGWKEPVG